MPVEIVRNKPGSCVLKCTVRRLETPNETPEALSKEKEVLFVKATEPGTGEAKISKVRSIDHLGTLKDTGLPVFTTAWVHAHISTILRNPILDMCEPKETVEKIRAATPQFEMLVYELNSYSIPDILVHGDFHRENVGDLVDEQYYKFFDWSSALIGHPFCDFAVMFFSMEEPEIDEEEAEQAYFGGWKKYGDVQALRRAAHVALIAYFCLNLHTLEMDYERAGAVEQQSLLKLCTESMGTVLLQLQVLEDGDNSKDVSAT